MKKKMMLAGLCLAGVMILPANVLLGQPNPESGIRAATEEMRQALKDQDAERLTRMYTEDARLTMANKVVEGREAIRAHAAEVLPVVGDFRCDEREFVPGDGIAVETGRATFLARSGAVLGVSRYMTVWKLDTGKWRIYRDLGVPVEGGAGTSDAGFTIKQTPAETEVVLPMRGSYNQHAEAIARLVEYARSAGIQAAGPLFGRYYNSPGSVPEDQLRWEVGLPVTHETNSVPAPFERRDSPAALVASGMARGRDTAGLWRQIGGWASGEGYRPSGPGMEIWLDNSRTEIRLPVQETGQ